jgi:hypothetical protein
VANVKVKAKQTLSGDYGQVKAGEFIEMKESDAKRLAERGVVEMAGIRASAEAQEEGKPTEGESITVTEETQTQHQDTDKTKAVDADEVADVKEVREKAVPGTGNNTKAAPSKGNSANSKGQSAQKKAASKGRGNK